MPEMHFTIRWPDGEEARCYSPSLIVREYLEVGREYPIDEFVGKTREMLGIASERVKAKYGYYCSAAMDQLSTIEARAGGFSNTALVRVLGFESKDGA
jgi:uncharacterized repeat protein (TIGR04042 family)